MSLVTLPRERNNAATAAATKRGIAKVVRGMAGRPPDGPPTESEGPPTGGMERPGSEERLGIAIGGLPPFWPPLPAKAFWLSICEFWRSWLAIVALTYCMRFGSVDMSTESLCCDPLGAPWFALSRLARALASIVAPLGPTVRLCKSASSDGGTPPCWPSPLSWTRVDAAP